MLCLLILAALAVVDGISVVVGAVTDAITAARLQAVVAVGAVEVMAIVTRVT